MHVMMGGSFDPVHEGHLRTAMAVKNLLNADQVFLVPNARSPLKQHTTTDTHRLAMLQLAVAEYPGLVVDECELKRPPPSYTIETLQAQRNDSGPVLPIVWIMGADSLTELDRWKNWQTLTDFAHLIIVQRPGYSPQPSAAVSGWLVERSTPDALNRLNCTPHGQCLFLDLPPQPFSSTAIRQALRRNAPVDGLPDTVRQYIQLHQLYT
jgi:nicotinate-nucleotide adenylyltransferase